MAGNYAIIGEAQRRLPDEATIARGMKAWTDWMPTSKPAASAWRMAWSSRIWVRWSVEAIARLTRQLARMLDRSICRHQHAGGRSVEHHVDPARGGLRLARVNLDERIDIAIRKIVVTGDHAWRCSVGAGPGRELQFQAFGRQVAAGLGQPQPRLRAGKTCVEQHAQPRAGSLRVRLAARRYAAA